MLADEMDFIFRYNPEAVCRLYYIAVGRHCTENNKRKWFFAGVCLCLCEYGLWCGAWQPARHQPPDDVPFECVAAVALTNWLLRRLFSICAVYGFEHCECDGQWGKMFCLILIETADLHGWCLSYVRGYSSQFHVANDSFVY